MAEQTSARANRPPSARTVQYVLTVPQGALESAVQDRDIRRKSAAVRARPSASAAHNPARTANTQPHRGGRDARHVRARGRLSAEGARPRRRLHAGGSGARRRGDGAPLARRPHPRLPRAPCTRLLARSTARAASRAPIHADDVASSEEAGIRPGELLAPQWYDLDGYRLAIGREVKGKGRAAPRTVGEPRTPAARRTVNALVQPPTWRTRQFERGCARPCAGRTSGTSSRTGPGASCIGTASPTTSRS